MPNIITKILHRKSRSGSSSASASDLTSPSAPGLIASRDRGGQSTIRLDDSFHGEPISPESRRKSMSASRGSPISPSAPGRKSLDARPNGIFVHPARPAPPPPVPEPQSHVLSNSHGRANGGTVVIDGRADPRQGQPHAHDADETTARSDVSDVFGSPPQRSHDADAAGQFDRRGLFDDTPAPSTALDHFSTSLPRSNHVDDLSREACAPPGPVDHTLDLDRDLPPLPRNPSHELKQVDSRRRPTMAETGSRQSVEGELGRASLDAPGRDVDPRRLSDGRGVDRSIEEESSNAGFLSMGDRRDGATSEVPTRGSSLRHLDAGGEDGRSIRSQATGRTGMTGNTAYYTPAGDSVEDKMAGLSLANHESTAMAGRQDGTDALEQQRAELVGSVVAGSERRREQRGELSEEGVRTFHAAGLGEHIGTASTVDVHTQWLKPVVQETIIPRIHTEYTTIITREIHRHHVYPKIQPIEDPNPIVLPPLHRIFSPATGKWHEVQGDDAAIAILGEVVFRNGPKEVRHARNPVTDDVLRRESEDINIPPVGADGKGVSLVAPATQAGRARVVEREGILGQDLGEWKKTERGHLFGKLREDIGLAL